MYKKGKLVIICHLMVMAVVCFLNTAYSDTIDDVVKVDVKGDEIIGLNAAKNVRAVVKLEEGETVTTALSKGEVGAVLTDRRLLGFNATNNTWASFDTFFSKAVFPKEIKVSSNMAVAIAERRVYAFTSISKKWAFELISLMEKTTSSEINDHYIFIRTSARVIAFSFAKQKWFPENIYSYETIKDISTGENYITVITEGPIEERTVTFDAKNGEWNSVFRRSGAGQESSNDTSPSEFQAESIPAKKSAAQENTDSQS